MPIDTEIRFETCTCEFGGGGHVELGQLVRM